MRFFGNIPQNCSSIASRPPGYQCRICSGYISVFIDVAIDNDFIVLYVTASNWIINAVIALNEKNKGKKLSFLAPIR